MTEIHRSRPSGESPSEPRGGPEPTALVLRSSEGKALSREQRRFNRLVVRIAELERDIASDRDRLERLLAGFHEKVVPLENTLARREIELARALATAGERFALRKAEKKNLRRMIVDLLNDAFHVVVPDAATEAFHDEWAETGYREGLRLRAERRQQAAAEDANAMSDDDVDDESAGVRSQGGEQEDASDPDEGRRHAGSKKHGRAEKLRQKEALTKKSVRDIYLSLAKVLHPDTVSDVVERSLREEFMKQAIHAYGERDIAALLKLELRWVARQEAALGDAALCEYFPALRAQEKRLERTLREQVLDPRFSAIGGVAAMNEQAAMAGIAAQAKARRKHVAATVEQLKYVKLCASKANFLSFVRSYAEAGESDADR